MRKILFISLAAVCLMSACSKDDPAQVSVPPVKTATKEPVNTLPPAPALSPTTSFGEVDSCTKAGYSAEQCSQAQSVANAMHLLDAPKYKTQKECDALFKKCQNRGGSFIPQMTGFSVAGQEKGKTIKPSRENPLYLLPLYTTSQNKLAEIKHIKGSMVLLPVGEKLPDAATKGTQFENKTADKK